MRYRIKEYEVGLNRLRRQVIIRFMPPAKVMESLETEEESITLTEGSRKYVIESIRVIADETQGGYILMSTGQKEVVSEITKSEDTGITIIIGLGALIDAADGDADDIAAINAMSGTDQFTIEVDWGDEPSQLAQETTSQEIKTLILQEGIEHANEYANEINEIIGDWSNE